MTSKNNDRPLAVVELSGGLGNQMFQYAFGTALALRENMRVKFDTTQFPVRKEHNGLDLDRAFDLTLDIASPTEMMKLSVFRQKPAEHNSRRTSGIYRGWWNSEKYFDDFTEVVESKFKWKNVDSVRAMQTELESKTAVAIHFRRGDYLTGEYPHTVLGADYYKRAIQAISYELPDSVFYVFSDDYPASAVFFSRLFRTFQKNITVRYIPPRDKLESYLDMYLMTKCKAVIMANSSFSWWGAKLNQSLDTPVIAPKKWYNDPNMKTDGLYLSGSRLL